ncbi:hypothetical protein DHODJN_22085 [Methylorubrum extorquens]
MTQSLEASSSRTASACEGESALPVFCSTQGRALSRSISRPGRRAGRPLDQPVGNAAFGCVEAAEEHACLIADDVLDDLVAALDLLSDCGADQASLDLQKLLGKVCQVSDRQRAVTLVHGRLEGEGYASPQALRRLLRQPELHGDRVSRLEADAANVLSEAVRVLGHDLDRVVTVGLVDAHRTGCADAMSVQEEHDLPHRLLLSPAAYDPLGALWADAADLHQAVGLGLDDLEGALSE